MSKEQEKAASVGSEPSEVQELDLNGLPLSEGAEILMGAFQASINKLEAQDRVAVKNHFYKLRDAFLLLGKSADKIFSSEEGRRLFEQEMKKKQGPNVG